MTDVGMVRAENQDSFRIARAPDGMLLAVVCDGMGGVAGGCVASKMAAEEFCRCAGKALSSLFRQGAELTDEDIRQVLRMAVEKANERVYIKSLKTPALCGMGTTLTGVLMREDWCWVVHVGDSRAYLFRRGRLRMITHDHSYVQMLVDTGRLAPEMAQHHPRKNIITRAVGTRPQVEADVFSGALQQGDSILLTSDGLTNLVEDRELSQILADGRPLRLAVHEMVSAANVKGGDDNITAVMVQTNG